uniref:Synaptobrevin, longin-like domain protein n=1 Tax=Tanacetum cinerariifolium TaxID=118510 RepID=A0A699GUX1_TANCI|nr:hypothetical protein [Tanacetum cinerariifolium]
MSLTFANSHNMVAYLNKSDASEGFNQVTDFLNGSYIKYALTVNPIIYVSSIKLLWNTVVIKQSNDVTRLQALVDKMKVLITEATIRDVLRLDDAEGIDCLPNEEIFAELARTGYEKPSTKLTFYKAFFSSQWKFIIHTILQSISVKRTSWNEFSSAMASAVIFLSTGRKFNFSKYIFESLVRNVDSSSKFYMYPRRVGKGCSGVETPLFKGMLVAGEIEEQGDTEEQEQDNVDDAAQGADTVVLGDDVQDQSIPSPTPPTPPPQPPQDIPSTSQEALDAYAALTRRVKHLEHDKVAQDLDITKLKTRVKKLERANKGRMIANLDRDTDVSLMDDEGTEKKVEDAQVAGDEQVKGRQAEIYQIDMDYALKVLSMQDDEPEVESVSAASATIDVVPAATITAVPVRVAATSTRRRKGVVIRDPEKESPAKTPAETKSKGKGIMVEEPKPIKKKQQVKMDEEYARKLHEELNQDIELNVAIDRVKQKAKEDPYMQRYQVMKKRPKTEAQARRNMIMYLKNTIGFRLDYFKGMSYDDIRLIIEAKFNSNMEFLLKSKEQLEEEENRAIESINETPAQKAAKRRKMNEDVEDLKWHLEIVPDEFDDVYTEATPLDRKVPVVDYLIIHLNNKPCYKIIRADGTHQLAMFERPDGQDQVWKSQTSIHGQAMVKSWKLLELCGVHIISFTTTKLILLVERRCPLSMFTLDQMLNTVRLQVEEQSEISLELLRFGVDAAMELEEKH